MVETALTKVLVVDDDQNVREILSDILTLKGFKVVERHSGRLAYELILKDESIDAVVSDIRMPDGDGVSLMKKLHALQRDSKPRLILITGYTDLTSAEAESFGVYALLSKPFATKELIDALTK